jgi:5'-nucleotidase
MLKYRQADDIIYKCCHIIIVNYRSLNQKRRWLGMKTKRTLRLVVFLVFLVMHIAAAADLSKLVIIHTNDTHGFDQRAKGINGMATVSALKKDYEAKGYTVLLLDAGDAIQDNNLVNFSKGKSAIHFMNACGYDAMALGNHEFDYGQDVLAQRVKEAKFPMLAANIYVTATGKNLVGSTAILNKGNYKIGVVGLTTPSTLTSTNPKNVYGLKFLAGKELYACVQKNVDYLHDQKCDVVLALGHLGSEGNKGSSRSDDVAANVKGLDLFIDGHDHQVKNEKINGALVVETGCHTENIGVLKNVNGRWQEELLAYGKFNGEDPIVKKEIDREAANINKYLGQKLGKTKVFLNGNRVPGVRTQETNLGDFCADAFLWQAKQASVLNGVVDGALTNGGGIRNSIPAGVITRGSLHGVMPYNNQLYVIKLKGSVLLEMLEAATCFIPEAMGAFPQVAGITYELDTKKPFVKGKQYPHSTYFAPAEPGNRVKILTVAGKPFNPNKIYAIAVAEFIAAGGDAYGATQTLAAKERSFLGYLDVQALENYVKEGLKGDVGAQYATPQGRIIVK